MDIIAFYLPQYHAIPENDKAWGKGFTEWVNVQNSKPLFEGHRQPRIPLNRNYYNLLDVNVQRWQAKIAKEYGVNGFCFYHYWFNRHLLLEKPVENFRDAKDIDMKYCLCWANEPWTKAWVSKDYEVIMPQKYGDRAEWIDHFNYFLTFFNDDRYIKRNNKPFLVIYRPSEISCLNEMLSCWRALAVENGFDGLDIAFQTINFDLEKDPRRDLFDYDIEYQPSYAQMDMERYHFAFLRKIKRKIDAYIMSKEGGKAIDIHQLINKKNIKNNNLMSYDDLWQKILERTPIDNKCIPGAFVDWDNSPRKGEYARICDGATPEKFERYMSELIKHTRDVYKKDMIFIYAWNEWAEGGYLEPDEDYGYGYLEGIKKALIENGYKID